MASKQSSYIVRPICPEIYAATSLFMAEIAEYNRSNLLARREFRLIEEHLENGTIPDRLFRLQYQRSFLDWLEVNRLFWPEDWTEDYAENIEFIVERLRIEYQEDIFRTSSGLYHFKQKARRFLKEGLADQAEEAVNLFENYCRAMDRKAALKPKRQRWSKSRSN